MTFALYLAVSVALALVEVWTLRAIAQEFSRQNSLKRFRSERREVTIARRLWSIGQFGPQGN